MTLEDLLRTQFTGKDVKDKDVKVTPEFRVSVQETKEEGVTFLIHPVECNGETLDYKVRGDILTPLNR